MLCVMKGALIIEYKETSAFEMQVLDTSDRLLKCAISDGMLIKLCFDRSLTIFYAKGVFVVCKIVNSISYEFGGVLLTDYHSAYRFKIFNKWSKFLNKQLVE